MKILAIDPSSNKIKTSTTGIVLLDNARLECSWVATYGMRGFKEWYTTILMKARNKINAIHLSRTQHQTIQLLVMSLYKTKRSLIKKKDCC